MISESTIAIRLLIAAGLGAAIGLEREWRVQPAGLRTHMLVSVGACLFTLVGAYAFAGSTGGGVNADVTRVASQVVVGVGFLGGGTILRHEGTIRGLTTAATLWVAAALGLATGAGFVFGGLIAAGVTLVALTLLKPFERYLTTRLRERPKLPPD
ncbi:MAG: MgtC/SapB family protein [Actinomycetota bacterium]|nr:MgtC/SapB family protein [Actinomycetota bacterium]